MGRLFAMLLLGWTVTVAGCGASQAERSARECREGGGRARHMIDEGGVLLDVRSPAEFAQQHLEEAVNIPVTQLERRAPDELDTDLSVVAYCDSGRRAQRAAEILSRLGFQAIAIKTDDFFCSETPQEGGGGPELPAPPAAP